MKFNASLAAAMGALLLGACGDFAGSAGALGSGAGHATTFNNFLARALAGEAESQNAVGYMLYHGPMEQRSRARSAGTQ